MNIKRLYLPFLLIGLLTCVTACDESRKDFVYKEVSVSEASQLVQENKDNTNFVILDVRTPEEFAEGHIKGAVNLNFRSSNFTEELRKLDRNKTYLVHCRSGGRSAGAVDVMRKENFRRITHMVEGIVGWTQAKYPTVR